MNLDIWETVKVVLALVGGALLVYQVVAVVTKHAPLREVVNPHRVKFLWLAAPAVVGVGAGALRYAVGSWDPDHLWRAVSPIFNQLPTDGYVKAALMIILLGVFGLGGSALFCYCLYPRDPGSFRAGRGRTRDQVLAEAKRAISHYTNQTGGLDYGAAVVLPSPPAELPTVAELLKTTEKGAAACGYRLIERVDEDDLKATGEVRHIATIQKVDQQQLRRQWLELGRTLYAQMLQQSASGSAERGHLSGVEAARIRWRQGGVLIEFLHKYESNRPDVIVFGITINEREEQNGRFDEHFDMLVAALKRIAPDRDSLGLACDVPAAAVSRSSAVLQLPAA